MPALSKRILLLMLVFSTIRLSFGDELSKPLPLIGSEQAIKGSYQANCPNDYNPENCWRQIIHQAERELTIKLQRDYPAINHLQLIYLDFTGSQRDFHRHRRIEMVADGTFFFEVIQPHTAPPVRQTQVEQQPWPPYPSEKERHHKADKPIDFTVSYVWDINDLANPDELAISSGRLGVGLWSQNRIGLVAFAGVDKPGIADHDSFVQRPGNHYDTFGLGIGYRLIQNRTFTVENMLYYVDAEPFKQTIAPQCVSCSSRVFESEDYVQATINLKTNTHGLNAGWMFTWKFLEQENFDNLSSGIYLELQF